MSQVRKASNTTKQINDYIRNQQLVIAVMDLSQTIKKADRSRQEVSAFRTQAISFIKANQLNQSAQGANQYATV